MPLVGRVEKITALIQDHRDRLGPVDEGKLRGLGQITSKLDVGSGLSFHSTGFKAVKAPLNPEMEKEYFAEWRLVRSALFQLDTMEVLTSMLASGV